MRVASLYSGGKDSTCAILKAKEMGNHIACLVSIKPASDESRLLHFPNSWLTRLQAEAMEIPIIEGTASDFTEQTEFQAISHALEKAKSEYAIQGVVHGGIKSDFQRRIFAQASAAYGIEVLSPLWHIEPRNYLHELILRYGFEIIVVSVSAMGLDDSWLGRRLDVDSIKDLERLSSKFGFNLTFEGGEAETIVTDCPLFISKKLDIRKSKKSWDGQRGIFEILEAALVNKAEGGEGTTVVV